MLYPLIDILRAAAVSLVVVYHVVGLGEWTLLTASIWTLPFRHGWMGVDLFLVISGFVVTLSAVRLQEKSAHGFRWQFMQRRLRRLMPLYALTCTAYVFMVRPEILMRPGLEVLLQVTSHALFLQNLSHLTHGVINGVTWSLALEMQFYLALVFAVRWLIKLGAGKTLLLLIVVSWAWRYGVSCFIGSGPDREHMLVVYTTQLPGTLDAFGFGIALAAVVFGGQGFWAQRLTPDWSNCLGWLAVAAGMLCVAGYLLITYDNYWTHAAMVIFFRTILAAGFAAALCVAVTCPLRGSGVLRPIRYLGQISYGIYLWHFPVLLALLALPSLRGGNLLIAVCTGTVLLASLSWHLMEKHWVHAPR